MGLATSTSTDTHTQASGQIYKNYIYTEGPSVLSQVYTYARQECSLHVITLPTAVHLYLPMWGQSATHPPLSILGGGAKYLQTHAEYPPFQ